METKKTSYIGKCLSWIGTTLASKLTRESSGYEPFSPSDFEILCKTLRPGDVLLVEGNQRISSAIKYLTQSTWSHAAFYVGDALDAGDSKQVPRLIEVDVTDGCIAVPLEKYASYNTRICRAVGLNDAERAQITAFMISKLGLRYDLRNIFDLLRYFFPTPPVPVRWRRRMLSMGSGDPTRAICSSLIAQSFQSIRYPILPTVSPGDSKSYYIKAEILHIRHHSLFAPRDFDLSPYFEIVKPTLSNSFDFHTLNWAEENPAPPLNAPSVSD